MNSVYQYHRKKMNVSIRNLKKYIWMIYLNCRIVGKKYIPKCTSLNFFNLTDAKFSLMCSFQALVNRIYLLCNAINISGRFISACSRSPQRRMLVFVTAGMVITLLKLVRIHAQVWESRCTLDGVICWPGVILMAAIHAFLANDFEKNCHQFCNEG